MLGASLQPPHSGRLWKPPAVYICVELRGRGGRLQIPSAKDLTIILPLSNLDVNVLATALPWRLEIVFFPRPEIIHPDRVVFIKVRLGERNM